MVVMSSKHDDWQITVLVKGGERYVFLYTVATRVAAMRIAGRYAADPKLSFTWYDAAVVTEKIRLENESFRVRPST